MPSWSMLIGYISNEMSPTSFSRVVARVFKCISRRESRQKRRLKTRATKQHHGRATGSRAAGGAGSTGRRVAVVECTSRHLRHVVHTHGVWERMTRRGVLMSADDAPASILQWMRLAHVAMWPINSSTTLQDGVTDCSSFDRATESPDNTLTLSPCWVSIREQMDQTESTTEPRNFLALARRAQRKCTCSFGRACYWSSTPSAHKAKDDFIEYSVSPQSLVRVVQAVPYRAFWQPCAPIYCPRAASLQFYSINRLGVFENEPLYESPMLPLENKMKLNEFTLPQSLSLPNGGIMRLKMHGRQQAQTLDPGPVPEYYTCISYVSALGNPLVELLPPQVVKQTEAEGKQ